MVTSPERTEIIPLTADVGGTIRVAGTRVTLDVLATAWRGGATPEQIVQQYDALQLADVYAVITWMLRHPAETDSYLASRAVEARQTCALVGGGDSQAGLRARLLARATEPPQS